MWGVGQCHTDWWVGATEATDQMRTRAWNLISMVRRDGMAQRKQTAEQTRQTKERPKGLGNPTRWVVGTGNAFCWVRAAWVLGA